MAQYKGKFNYDPSVTDYECKVRRGLPWWFWLLIAIPLLLIASLFIRCSREITVQVVDEANNPIENAEVAMLYTARYCPWLKEDIARHGETNSKGEYKFKDLPCSVWSYIFYRGEKAEFTARLGNIEGSRTAPFHTTDRVVIKLVIPQEECQAQVRVIDNFTGAPIAGAEVLVTVDGSGRGILTTDGQGLATISGIYNRSRVSAAARHPGYLPNDTTIVDEPGINIRDKVTDIPLDPKVLCNQTVEHYTGDPHVMVDKIDMGTNSGTVNFTYYTDSWEDQLIVRDENGRVLIDTGLVATYSNRVTVPLNFSTRYVSVEIISKDGAAGSVWEFTIDCP